MQRLWAPWRERYITKVLKGHHSKCVFCDIIKNKNDRKNYIFLRTSLSFAVLNIFPYSNGHCLILPNRHVADISQLKTDEIKDIMDLCIRTKALLQKVLKPHGFNMGMNLGRLAGAGIPGHLHMHVVPRWRADHNFMPITAGTKVISQSLHRIYQELIHADKKRYRASGR